METFNEIRKALQAAQEAQLESLMAKQNAEREYALGDIIILEDTRSSTTRWRKELEKKRRQKFRGNPHNGNRQKPQRKSRSRRSYEE